METLRKPPKRKEAARRAGGPKSREETPKEGIGGNNVAAHILYAWI